MYTQGNFNEARDAMREVRLWLLKVPVEEYTEVQVRYLELRLEGYLSG